MWFLEHRVLRDMTSTAECAPTPEKLNSICWEQFFTLKFEHVWGMLYSLLPSLLFKKCIFFQIQKYKGNQSWRKVYLVWQYFMLCQQQMSNGTLERLGVVGFPTAEGFNLLEPKARTLVRAINLSVLSLLKPKATIWALCLDMVRWVG